MTTWPLIGAMMLMRNGRWESTAPLIGGVRASAPERIIPKGLMSSKGNSYATRPVRTWVSILAAEGAAKTGLARTNEGITAHGKVCLRLM